MRNLIYNAQTKETTYEEVADVISPIIEFKKEPTIEERIATVESTVGTVVETLADIVGVI